MTRRSVTDDQYGKLWRRLEEVALRVDRGTILYDPVMDALTLVIEGKIPRPDFKRDMRKEAGWELVEDVREPAEICVGNFDLATFLNRDEQYIMGEEMGNRAKNIGANLGQRHAEYFLERQQEIPEEWRKYYLIFPGTKWRDRHGPLRVPYLYWHGECWHLVFDWLDYGFSSLDRLLRPRK